MDLKTYFPVTLTVDGEQLRLRIKRMTVEENAEFMSGYRAVSEPPSRRFVARASLGPEQEKDEKGAYKIPFEALEEKQIPELPPDRRAEYEKAVREHDARSIEFLKRSFAAFVTVEKGELFVDGDPVIDGLDLLQAFGARQDVIADVLGHMFSENTMDASQKKTWQSLIASSSSSSEPAPDPPGPKPETTASPAETEASAETEPATSPPSTPSGSTETSSSNPVQSSP